MGRAKIFIVLEILVLCVLFAVIGIIVTPHYLNIVEDAQYTVVESTAGALNAAVQLQALSQPEVSCQEFFNHALEDAGMQAQAHCQMGSSGVSVLKEAAFCVLGSPSLESDRKCMYGYSQNLKFAIEYQPNLKKIAIVQREQ